MEPVQLADRLHRLADRTAPPSREDLAEVVVARHRARRRETVGMLAVAAAVATVVLVVPQVLDSSPSGTPAGPTTSDLPLGVDVLTGPTRGSLAQDDGFVDGVRRLPWSGDGDPEVPGGLPTPPPEARHVVFAGDVPGGRWALVGGTDGDSTSVAWFVGPAGAGPDQLELASLMAGIQPGTPVALSDPATGTLVVVGAPGDTVEISRRPDVSPDGRLSRAWAGVETADGIAAVALSRPAVVYDEALRFRVSRGGTEVAGGMPPSFRSGDYRPPSVTITWLREPPSGPSVDPVLTETAYEVLTRLGLSPADVAFDVVWAGDLPAPDGPSVGLQLLTATLPSGATYTEARLSRETGQGVLASSWCGTELRPVGPPPAEQTFVVRCDVTDVSQTAAPVSSLVVVGPATAVRARALDAGGQALAEFDLVAGVAVVDLPGEVATVQTLDADGAVLAEQALMGVVDWSVE